MLIYKDQAIEPLIVPVAYPGRTDAQYDLTVLLLANGHEVAVGKSVGAIDSASVRSIDWHRLALLRGIHQIISSRLVEGASARSNGNLIQRLRMFWRFAEAQRAIPNSFSATLWSKTFADWIQSLWQQVKQGAIVERSAGTYAWSIAGVFAEVFEMPTEEFVGRTMMPRVNISASSNRYENLDLVAIDRFLSDLDDIVNSIPVDASSVQWPHRVEFRDSAAYVFPSVGLPTATSRRAATSAEWSRLLALRAQAEMLRFLGATGCNLQVAADLLLTDCTFESFGSSYRVRGLKNRRNDFVDIRVPKSYRAKLESWIEFRRLAFPSDTQNSDRLFPLISRSGQQSAMAAERGFRNVRRVLASQGKKMFGPMELRFARAQRLMRSQAVGNDTELVSRELQNSVATLHRSYLRGNQQMSAVEFGKFVATILPAATTQRLRNGGACERPEQPQRIDFINEDTPEPDCTNLGGCFFCSNFRAVADRDFVHAMLSYRKFLRIRSSLCSDDRENFFRDIAPTIERIDDFVKAMANFETEIGMAVKAIEELVSAGQHHRHWQGWIELATLSAA